MPLPKKHDSRPERGEDLSQELDEDLPRSQGLAIPALELDENSYIFEEEFGEGSEELEEEGPLPAPSLPLPELEEDDEDYEDYEDYDEDEESDFSYDKGVGSLYEDSSEDEESLDEDEAPYKEDEDSYSSLSSGLDSGGLDSDSETSPANEKDEGEEEEEKPKKKKDSKGLPDLKPLLLGLPAFLLGLLFQVMRPFRWLTSLILKPFGKFVAATAERTVTIVSTVLAVLSLIALPVFILFKVNTVFALPVSQELPDDGLAVMSAYELSEDKKSVRVLLENQGELEVDIIAKVEVSSSKLLNPFTWFTKKPAASCMSEVLTIPSGESLETVLSCDKKVTGQGISFTGGIE